MDIDAIKSKAKHLDEQARREMAKPYFQNVVAWFVYLGLLRHNTIQGRRVKVPLRAALKAGELEPRVLEILPAVMIQIPEIFEIKDGDVPSDLGSVIAAVKRRKTPAVFRGVPPEKYLHWLSSPAVELAAKRLRFRSLPRARTETNSEIAEVLKRARIERALTQKELAESFGLSLRVIRDLEQGKRTASLQHVTDVLGALGRRLVVS